MIVKIFDLRRARGNPVAGVSAEARAIIDEWTRTMRQIKRLQLSRPSALTSRS